MKWLGVVLILGLWILPTAAQAKPIEAKSENFILYGNVSKGNATSLLTDLEDYRAAIGLKLGISNLSREVIPVRIFTAMGPNEIEEITGAQGSAGVYLTKVDGPVFVLNSQGGFTRGKRARQVALHEYTHHLMASYSSDSYPRWFDEGIAEYLSTFKIDSKGRMSLGILDQNKARILEYVSWLPFETVFNSIRRYPFPNDDSRNTQLVKSVFYAQSWLAVHYIQSNPEYSPKFVRYIDLLNQADTPVDAFEQAFDMTVAEFESVLKAYHESNRFKMFRISSDARTNPKIDIRTLTKSELALRHAEATRHFRPGKTGYAEAEKLYQKAEQDPALSIDIIISKALYLSDLKDIDEALALILPAAEANPENSEVQRVAGMALLIKNDTGDVPNAEEIAKARAYLKAAMILDSENIPAHYFYAQTFLVSRDTPDAQAIASARTALDYYRSINFVDKNVDLAEVLIRGGQSASAVPALEKAMAWSNSKDVRYYARSQLARLGREDLKE